jgi:L-ascorbate metabolism protein UlaG (beta-lactamase superfamily)
LITYGHGDHLGDVLRIAAEAKPKAVVAIHEIAVWLNRNGVEHVTGMNRGGTVRVEGIDIAMVAAVHSSSIADPGGAEHPGGEASGFVLTLADGFRVYHAGDTDVFGDMALIGEIHKPDLALLPIGDHYTMGPSGAARAARLLGVHRVIPIHWGTFPALTGTPDALRAAGEADGLTVFALKPGETLT